MNNTHTKKITMIGMLAATAWIISIFSFPLLYWVPFLKVDFSDIPVLLGMYIYGPSTGIGIAAIRSVLSYATSGGEAGLPIGDMTAFIASLSYTLPVYFIIKKSRMSYKIMIVATILGTLTLATILSFVNYLIVLPLYIKIMDFDVGPMKKYFLYSLIPFNLLKGVLLSLVFFSVFYSIKSYLDRIKEIK